MEINITKFFNNEVPSDYCASICEIGQNAATDAWNAAKDNSEDYLYLLDTTEKREAFIEHMKDMGFSEGDEMSDWPAEDLVALFIQLISGGIREFTGDFGADTKNVWNWEEYEKHCIEGNCTGNLFLGADGQIYYSLW